MSFKMFKASLDQLSKCFVENIKKRTKAINFSIET